VLTAWLLTTKDNKPYKTPHPGILFELWTAQISGPTCLEQGI
jgi:hypothetical protein